MYEINSAHVVDCVGVLAVQLGSLFKVGSGCNRKAIVRDRDLVRETEENRPLVRRVTGLEPNAQRKLLLEFVPTRNYATVSAIEVVAQGD